MKTTIDIPDEVLQDAMKYSKAATKREAVVAAVEEFNRRHRLKELSAKLGQSDGFFSDVELSKLRSAK